MELVNFDDFVKEKTCSRSVKPKTIYGLMQPFRLLIVGTSNSGKTNTTLNLFVLHQNFDHIVYVADLKNEDKLKPIDQVLNFDDEGNPLDEKIFELVDSKEFMSSIDDDDSLAYDIDKLDTTKQHLYVFDDAINFPKQCQARIEKIFTRGRKNGVSSIYIAHRYFTVPKVIRQNTTHVILFKSPTKQEENMVINDVSLMIPPDIMRKVLRNATSYHLAFLLVDKTVNLNDLSKHLRQGFGFTVKDKESGENWGGFLNENILKEL